MLAIAERFMRDKVKALPGYERIDALLFSPCYGHVLERLMQAIHPDTAAGEAPEVPIYDRARNTGTTAEVDWWTSKDVRPTTNSHLNFMVADTKQWEQSAAGYIDRSRNVRTWVKNAGLGFTIPYLHNAQMHDYHPDFIIAFHAFPNEFLILETKGYDPLMDVKRAAAERWCRAVNADGKCGTWHYLLTTNIHDVPQILNDPDRAIRRDA
jgi:type III restriction enzyme